ncbi:YifB family Mg chelatase-like AAA ATPase [Pseudohongiella acticola]|uniref:YifB family Mg chelatase-like AAA ATPase n=1 Tax=Pseudohongiella acticola TaxID=1524254 RepID=UPI0030EE0E34
MSLAVVYTRANQGVDSPLVTVETHLSNGLPALSMVGLPETAVRESRERVRSAILNAGLEFPARRITINMAPAGVPKSGGRYDLAIALSILAASEQLPKGKLATTEVLGELALAGDVRGVQGVLPAVIAARDAGRSLMVPAANTDEATLVVGATTFAVTTLQQACQHFVDQPLDELVHSRNTAQADACPSPVDMADIRGQHLAKRALLIAAAGAHNMLMVGPPGTGKTLLANTLPGLLPTLSEAHALASASIRSVAGQPLNAGQWAVPPFRAPHHSASGVAMVGGGRHLTPGEVTLAHAGVLFLDELTEFKRHVLECLREPLESGTVTIARADYRVTFPARFQLIAAMNPCPCGYHGDSQGQCRCTPERIARYLEKISGPLLDRIDLHVEVPRLDYRELMGSEPGDDLTSGSAALRERVVSARERQLVRAGVLNSRLTAAQLESVCALNKDSDALLQQIVERLRLSARACHRLIKLARTIADLESSPDICPKHLAEAASYRGISALSVLPAL